MHSRQSKAGKRLPIGWQTARMLDFRDEAPLTVSGMEGHHPGSRELSGAWLAGTVLTGLTSVFLMGGALYVSFSSLGGYSTAYRSLDISAASVSSVSDGKTDRARPSLQTRSEKETVSGSMVTRVGDTDVVYNANFVRVMATLATSETALTDDVSTYVAEAYLDVLPEAVATPVLGSSSQTMGAEARIEYKSIPSGFAPDATVSDAAAASFVATLARGSAEPQTDLLAYFAPESVDYNAGSLLGIAENMTVIPKTTMGENSRQTSERVIKLDADASLNEILIANGFTPPMAADVQRTIQNFYNLSTLQSGSRLRILLGPSSGRRGLVPYRLSIYLHDNEANADRHAVTVALTDAGRYVVALEPPSIPFSEESTERISVANLPSIYKSIWETGRRNDVPDETIAQIVSLVAYDADLTQRVQPGDTIELLMASSGENEADQLSYVAITLGNTERNFYRFVAPDGSVGFFDEAGESGRRFLLRRPLEGGGRLTSAMGTRIDPFNGGNANHQGTDFAAPRGTPIYAAADGVVEMAQWFSSYGRYVRIKHLNGYQTAYAHMNDIADGITAGGRVRQGQVIGYVGSTGRSTGNHLHFELEINGRVADPLQVKLPRSRTLQPQYLQEFNRTVEQVRSLMESAAGTSGHGQAV